MRKYNKYKGFKLSGIVLKKFPLRLLKFRRPKWNILQQQLKTVLLKQQRRLKKSKNRLKKSKQNSSLVNTFLIKNSFKTWSKTKKYYKIGFKNKNILLNRFDKAIKFSFLKKRSKFCILKKDFILNYLVYPEFRIDILLWNLNLFYSSYQARQSINNNDILVNGKFVKANTFLKKGDIISFIDKGYNNHDFKKIVDTCSKNEKFLTFVEIDYYTKTIVILKSYNELSSEDMFLLVTEYINIKNFSYNL
jgi:ribosomal protein S4